MFGLFEILRNLNIVLPNPNIVFTEFHVNQPMYPCQEASVLVRSMFVHNSSHQQVERLPYLPHFSLPSDSKCVGKIKKGQVKAYDENEVKLNTFLLLVSELFSFIFS